ncbi:MAG: 2-methylthioadenine synthetase [Parcubacteria group bacterium GW2011_GWA2_47_10]|nr:MAG: 2-methylthioadenine synthetase [Parcubacteria group bacterium GW2011_GWA2_47_10]
MKRVAFHTLGCKLNLAETSTIGRQFVDGGFEVVKIDQKADVCVINTCSVTERADRECRQIVRRALRHSPEAFVIVIGCYAQLQPEEIASIPGVDLVLGSKEKFDIFRFANGFSKSGEAQAVVSPLQDVDTFSIASSQDGCDYSCSFCTIPLARGASRSLEVTPTVSQAREIVAAGYKEIVLTGVNVGDYGKKIDTNLLALLRDLVAVEGLERIRISSIEPNLLSDELLEFWLGNEKLCKHFHMPLQAGSDELLKGMRRRYLTDWYADRVSTIKSAHPDAGIGVDIIVGFPGETDELFEETYRFLVELPVSYLHVFTYSERPHTHALTLPDHIEPRLRFERSERLRILGAKKRRAFDLSFVGSTVEVLFEGESDHGWMTGLTGEYVRAKVPTEYDLSNQIRKTKIKHFGEEGCIGELVDTSFPQPINHQAFPNEVTVCV